MSDPEPSGPHPSPGRRERQSATEDSAVSAAAVVASVGLPPQLAPATGGVKKRENFSFVLMDSATPKTQHQEIEDQRRSANFERDSAAQSKVNLRQSGREGRESRESRPRPVCDPQRGLVFRFEESDGWGDDMAASQHRNTDEPRPKGPSQRMSTGLQVTLGQPSTASVVTSTPLATNCTSGTGRIMEVDRSLLLGGGQLQQLVTSLLESSEQCPEDLLHAEPRRNDRTLLMFVNLIYTEKNSGESATNYGEMMLSGELFKAGWRCLITYNNTSLWNGYFGSAFYHSGQQQVVVAHRGTDLTCSGAVFTDIAGIYGTIYTSCMNSVKYLAIKLLASHSILEKNSEAGTHAKTVGFDSPGARDMLNRVLDNYYNRYVRNVPHLEGLDITLYLSAPNHINTCGVHIGGKYHVRNDVFTFTLFDKETHAMNNFVYAFKNDNCIFGEVLDRARNTIEFYKLFEILWWNNNYHAQPKPDNTIFQEIFKRN